MIKTNFKAFALAGVALLFLSGIVFSDESGIWNNTSIINKTRGIQEDIQAADNYAFCMSDCRAKCSEPCYENYDNCIAAINDALGQCDEVYDDCFSSCESLSGYEYQDCISDCRSSWDDCRVANDYNELSYLCGQACDECCNPCHDICAEQCRPILEPSDNSNEDPIQEGETEENQDSEGDNSNEDPIQEGETEENQDDQCDNSDEDIIQEDENGENQDNVGDNGPILI